LSALHFIRSRYGDKCRAVLYEAENRLGGTIGTDRVNGFISDWGPNGFLDRVPLTLEMISELDADDMLVGARNASGKRFILRHQKLHEISASPPAFLRSSLLSMKGRLRVASEPFAKKRRSDDDESIYDFAARRIGPEAASVMIDSMVSGIFGGNARELSLEACFPVMKEMEDQYGSLFKAMIAKKRAAKKEGRKSSGPAGPGGRLTSFTGGLNSLIEIFERRYGDAITTGCPIAKVTRSEDGYRVSRNGGSAVDFDAVVCATPAYVTAELVSDINPGLTRQLKEIPYASITVVCLGYRRKDIEHDLDGFGFLVPRGEGLRILGTIWTSSIFPGRAPEGMAQLRTMIGGATDPDAINLSDGELLDTVTGELGPILDIIRAPSYVRIFRYPRGIPQFVIGHPARMKQMESLLKAYPGLYFTGNAYRGVGLNDCVVRSHKVVMDMAEKLGLNA